MTDLTGHSIGRYHILKPLGEGGMAVVYKAFDTRLEREVALKVIRTELYGEGMLETVLKRFDREAKALARLAHPNIVRVHDYGEYEGAPYLVMEFLSGGTLKARTGLPMPYQEAARLLAPVAHALDFAHSQGILHRDVKPANIMITASGDPMLTDFGIAKILEAQEDMVLTGTGVGLGTPEYMAPEQGMGAEVDVRTDIYALGVVLYELVAGRKPFQADTPMAVVVKHITEPLPHPSNFVLDLPAEVEYVIIKALAKLPEDRYPNAKAFALALEKLAVGVAESTLPAQTLQAGIAPSTQASATPTPTAPPVEPPITAPSEPGVKAVVVPAVLEAKKPGLRPLPFRASLLGRAFVRVTGCLIALVSLGLLVFILLAVSSAYLQVPDSFLEQATRLAQETGYVLASPTLMPKSSTRIATFSDTFPPGQSLTQAAETLMAQLDQAAPTLTETPESSTSEPAGMVWIEPGYFWMGSQMSDPYGQDDEKPTHQVYLDGFWIERTEVTNAMHALCVQAGVCQPPAQFDSAGTPNYYKNTTYRNYPVIYVSWEDARQYCKWAGRRLPTEAEWEKAARGIDGRLYPWGDSITCALANYWGSETGCVGDTNEVGSYPAGASPYYVLEMAGNVREWVADWYDESYYAVSPPDRPRGPLSGTQRVVRGGAWNIGRSSLRAAEREGLDPLSWFNNLGFRCAMDKGE